MSKTAPQRDPVTTLEEAPGPQGFCEAEPIRIGLVSEGFHGLSRSFTSCRPNTQRVSYGSLRVLG